MATKKKNKGKARTAQPAPSDRKSGTKLPKRSHALPGLIIGLGASAGGLEAFQRFFRAMPADSSMAFVVIAHLDPKLKSALSEVLGRATGMKVDAVSQPVEILPNRVYVIAPDSLLRVSEGKLVPSPRPDHNAPVDELFLSMAEEYGPRAVCIVLSGTGSDGTLGIRAAKEAGGLTIAQTGDTAAYASMPRSAAATGLVDLVLAVEQMPAALQGYLRRIDQGSAGDPASTMQRDARDYLVSICTLLRKRTGHDFRQYKESTLIRRIHRRMQVTQLENVGSYVDKLRKEPAEIDLLFQDLLIGVTHFFRDRKAFDVLQSKVIPSIFQHCIDDCVRVWVPGCATGEEAYSLAILLREHMLETGKSPRVQIFATDIDERALEFARAGLYAGATIGDLPTKRLKQFFLSRGNVFQVSKDIREMCVFSHHDLVKDPPFSRLDLVSCRNVLIYMNAELQARVLPLFHFALRPGRYLFLGPSETVTQHPRLFTTIDAKRRIFCANPTTPPQLPPLPGPTALDDVPSRKPAMVSRAGHKAVISAVERALLGAFMPAHVVVNDRFDLIYASAGTGKYLELAAGTPSANVMNMARKGLRPELRAALAKSLQSRQRVVVNDLTVGTNGGTQPIRLIVQPLRLSEDAEHCLLVVFEDIASVQPASVAKAGPRERRETKLVQQLESELASTQERLQTTIEELETSNEELKSSNEEFQSMNEELQSANEELETSREELQSVNEELETVNNELTAKIDSLDRVNNDLKNLLESTQIATIFLDTDNRIKNFTPSAKDIFRLIESDLGRPLSDIASRLADGTLLDDVAKVIRSLTPVEREVSLADGGTTFVMRVLPYRTTENVIDGVVVTFIDITGRKALEEERLRLGTIVALSRDAIIGVALDGAVTAWNAGAERMLGYPAREATGRRWSVLFASGHMEEERQEFERAQRDEPSRLHDSVMVAAGGKEIPVSVSISPARDMSGKVIGVSVIARDITERKQAEERQRLLLAELNHRVKNMLATVLSIANQTIDDTESSAAFRRSFTGRIRALSETQNLLTRTNWSGVTMRDVLRAEAAPHVKHGSENFVLQGPELLLTPRAALTLALIVHELATNALKHGALSVPAGKVTARWSVAARDGGRMVALEWEESGGPKVNPPKRRGFGRRLIEEGLTYELGGRAELRFAASGFNCRIELSAADTLADDRT